MSFYFAEMREYTTPQNDKTRGNSVKRRGSKRKEEDRTANLQIGDCVGGPSRCLIGAESFGWTQLD